MRADLSPWSRLTSNVVAVGEQSDAIGKGTLARADGPAQLGTLLETALRWYLCGADAEFPRFIEINDTPEIADKLFAAVCAETRVAWPGSAMARELRKRSPGATRPG